MALAQVNLGTPPSGLDGDDARAAFTKINLNMAELNDSGLTGVTNRTTNDCNTATEPGLYNAASGSAANRPPFMNFPLIRVSKVGGPPYYYIQQHAVDIVTDRHASRICIGGSPNAWTAWLEHPALQTSATDNQVSRAMRPGAFGLGGQAIVLASDDNLDNQRPSGLYYVTNIPNRPAGAYSGYGYLCHIALSVNPETEAVQYYTPYNRPQQYWVRTRINNIWGAWANISSLGFDQQWNDVTASRSFGTTYTNNKGRPIQISVLAGPVSTAAVSVWMSINGVAAGRGQYSIDAGQYIVGPNLIIPEGAVYSVQPINGTAPLAQWCELY
ncbi:pyocin knob domain-containing protein [Pseudomonas wadenswilerensis]